MGVGVVIVIFFVVVYGLVDVLLFFELLVGGVFILVGVFCGGVVFVVSFCY